MPFSLGPGTGTLKNRLLRKLAAGIPFIIGLYYSLLAGVLIYFPLTICNIRLTTVAGLFLFGIALWTLIEYILHRYIFQLHHNFPSLGKILKVFHGLHQENPRAHEHLFVQPFPGTLIIAVACGLLYISVGSLALPLMSGVTGGYLAYCYIHYTVHTRPSKLPFHKLWIHHLKHHHKYPDKAYGVTSPIWDMVFGTMPPENTDGSRHFST